MNSAEVGDRAQVARDTGSMVEKVSHAANSSSSALGRIGATAAAVRIGTRLLPATWRFFKRHPAVGSLLLVAVIGAAYMARPARVSAQ
jgi:hypothetical protein